MTQSEHRAKLSSLAHTRDKLIRANTRPTQEQHDKLISIARETNKLLRSHLNIFHFRANTHYTELYLLTQYIPHKKLDIIFAHFDDKEKHEAIIPKSFYTNRYIQNTTTKMLPKPLKRHGARGYAIPLQQLADILATQTSLEHSFTKSEDEITKEDLKRAKTDFRPIHTKL